MRTSWMCTIAMVLLSGIGAATPAVGQPAEPLSSRSFAPVARAIGPAIVRLDVTGAGESATASGVVLDTRGDIVTSRQLFEGLGAAPAVQVTLGGGRRLEAELVGMDANSGVAVVRLSA